MRIVHRHRLARFAMALAALTTTTVGVVGPSAGSARAASKPEDGCQLGNGVKHVVQITFDNVHFFRDNPNVPSDLELMPHLLNFIKQNGTMLSNNHTPLIAHTATDSLTNYTGLYGDRHGMPVSNSFRTFNPDGTTDPGVSFAYWTDPIFDTAGKPNPGHDTSASMLYSPTPPAFQTPATTPNTITPAPWVPFTRAGCSVGDVSTANMVLENTAVDIPKVFGPASPETQQLTADPNSFKDAETADYVGLSVHCAQGDVVCSSAKGVKYGQTAPTPTQVPDVLPTEPGGYNGFNALFGHRYIAPQLGAGTPNKVSPGGTPVTNGAGNLVDLAGDQINGSFTTAPGFPGFGDISASQSLAYMADMQESGLPVTYGYISDLHGNHFLPNTPACANAPDALPPGDPCYIQQAQAFDAAFSTFFTRLAHDGVTPQNSLFVFTADEGDHVAGANVGRAVQPTPPTCDGAKVTGNMVAPDVACTYPAGTFGELSTNITGLLATQQGIITPFTLHSDSAPQFYVTGNPPRTDTTVRNLERGLAGLTANNPYSGNPNEKITNYLADPVEQGILHIVNADPLRTPTFTLFAKPDYFLFPGGKTCPAPAPPTISPSPCVSIDNGFAYNHGDYAAEINTTWLGLVGPGVAHKGVDGLDAAQGPNSAGPNSGQVTVPGSQTTGTWADHTDIRPTMLYLVGLQDDYTNDGRVLTEDLTRVSEGLQSQATTDLAAIYKQLNSSVGLFATSTLMASTTGIESTSPGDKTYTATMDTLAKLGAHRDRLATTIKNELTAAAFDEESIDRSTARSQIHEAQMLIQAADRLAHGAEVSDS